MKQELKELLLDYDRYELKPQKLGRMIELLRESAEEIESEARMEIKDLLEEVDDLTTEHSNLEKKHGGLIDALDKLSQCPCCEEQLLELIKKYE
jgi:t-SNARE complex subunit (syntaxin)